MSFLDIEQNSPEWRQARCGSLGASEIHEAIARTKSGWGASRANLAARLIAERLTGVPQETYQNAAMAHGTATEPEARAAYEFRQDVDVREVGLVRHPVIAMTHASPDGLVGDDGLVEIKAPNTATHIETLLGASVPGKYLTQIQWQMACCGRLWCDYCSFDPRLPEHMRLFVKRIFRDDAQIRQLESDVSIFLKEVSSTVERLQHLINDHLVAA